METIDFIIACQFAHLVSDTESDRSLITLHDRITPQYPMEVFTGDWVNTWSFEPPYSVFETADRLLDVGAKKIYIQYREEDGLQHYILVPDMHDFDEEAYVRFMTEDIRSRVLNGYRNGGLWVAVNRRDLPENRDDVVYLNVNQYAPLKRALEILQFKHLEIVIASRNEAEFPPTFFVALR